MCMIIINIFFPFIFLSKEFFVLCYLFYYYYINRYINIFLCKFEKNLI